MAKSFIVHDPSDNVCVAMRDIPANTKVKGGLLAGQSELEIYVKMTIPMGHKFALEDIGDGEEVVRYGNCIGIAISSIQKGEHVHIHNVKSNRCYNK